MCFKALGVMFYLVGSGSKKEREGKERQRQESKEGRGGSVKLNYRDVNPLFPCMLGKPFQRQQKA